MKPGSAHVSPGFFLSTRHFPCGEAAGGAAWARLLVQNMGVIVMRLSKLAPWAALAALCVPAEALAAPGIACQLAEVYACTSAGCQKTSAKTNNLPAAVELNVKEKNLFSGLFGGEGLLHSGDVYEDEKVLILHGRRALQTWTAVVDKNTGAYSGSVSQIGKSFTQFGTCTGITR